MDGMNFPQLFRKMLVTKLRQSLSAVQSAPMTLPAPIRDQALHILSYALNKDAVEESVAWPLTSKLLLELAPRMELMGHRLDWMPFLERGIVASQLQNESKAAAEYELQLGILYRLVSQFDVAVDHVERSIQHFASLGDKRGEARSLNEFAWIKQLTHQQEDAYTYAMQALDLLGDSDIERAMSYRALGMVANNRGEWSEAEAFHRQALAICELTDDKQKRAWSLQNIANSLRHQKKFLEAIEYYKIAISELERLQDNYRLGIAQIGLGAAYHHSQDYQSAILCFQNAEQIATPLHDNLQLAMVYANWGLAELALSLFDDAIDKFSLAVDLYGRVGDVVWELNAMDGLAQGYLGNKSWRQAITTLESAIQRLPLIQHSPNYDYLYNTLNQHLVQAQLGLQSQDDLTGETDNQEF